MKLQTIELSAVKLDPPYFSHDRRNYLFKIQRAYEIFNQNCDLMYQEENDSMKIQRDNADK